MRLAIASPSSTAYSETFIRMQMERLPCIMRIHGGPVANETIPGGIINPMRSLRGLIDLTIECGFRKKKWEGPQSRELARRLKYNNVDTILANFGPTGVALLPICRKLGIRLFVHYHGYDAHRDDVLQKYGDAYIELGREAAGIIVVSEKMKNHLIQVGLPETRIHVARCGVDTTKFKPKTKFPSYPLFFGVGRFVDKKAPYLTILAFEKVVEQCPDAKLVLGGTGELLEVSQNLAICLGLENAICFPGVLQPDEVAAYMHEATAFVQHSITPKVGSSQGDSEGTPVAIMEAMMVGLPVISTIHAGIGEIVQDGVTGLLVEERDVEGMAKAMLKLAKSRDYAVSLGTKAREVAEKYFTDHLYISRLQEILTCG